MGTRGFVRLCDAHGRVYANIYCHWDGYPEGLGSRLYRFLLGFKVRNGLDVDADAAFAVRKYDDIVNFVTQDRNISSETRFLVVHAAGKALSEARCRMHRTSKEANGPGCLYAQLVAHLKLTVGSIYLEVDPAEACMAEYVYEIRTSRSGSISVQVDDGSPMDVEAFGGFCGATIEERLPPQDVEDASE